jgi:hypothetical protein
MIIIKRLFPLFLLVLSGCATIPPVPIDMSWYSNPTEGKAGIYFYHSVEVKYMRPIDVKFILDNKIIGKINSDEWLYFEVPAGIHKYTFSDGIFPQIFEFNFVEGQNYFFHGFILMGRNTVIWINDEVKIKEAIKNIESGRYKRGEID